MTDSRLAATAALLWLAFVAIVYVPVAGQGFVKDDFAWVAAASRVQPEPAAVFVADSSGTFYRPMVTLSFLADLSLYGLHARGYGFTNILLMTACAAGIVLLFRTLEIGIAAATAGALVWTANPHAVNMAVLWISGRTSLLMTVLSCLSVVAFLRSWRIAGTLLFLGALLSKEDALAVPIVVLAIGWLVQARRPASLGVDLALMTLAVGVYAWVRLGTNAISPANAPSFYQLTSDPSLILRNLVAYLDRSATGAAVIALVAALAYRARPVFAALDRRLLVVALIWFVAGLAITVRVPVRSSLYALFPSVGAALAFAVTIEALRRRQENRQRDRLLVAALGLPLLLTPVYYARSDRWVDPARVSASTVAQLQADAAVLPESGVVVFEDSPEQYANFRDVFGPLSAESVRLITGKPLDAIVLPPGDTRGVPGQIVRYRVDGFQVGRVAP